MIEPSGIVKRERLLLAGLSFFGDPFAYSDGWSTENAIGRLWQRFMAFYETHDGHIPGMTEEQASFEVHIEHPETQTKGLYEVFVGVPVDRIDAIPVPLVVKILPPVRYAVFTLHGEEITSDWPRRIYEEWLPTSPYREAYAFNFQYYDERFKGIDRIAESIIDVYVPIAPRE